MWGIFEIDELAGAVNVSVSSSPKFCFGHSPEFEPIGTSSDEFGVVEMLMLIDSEVASANTAHPVGSSFAWNYGRNVFGVKRGNTDLGDELGVALISFNIDADEDDRGFLLKSGQLTGMEVDGRRKLGSSSFDSSIVVNPLKSRFL